MNDFCINCGAKLTSGAKFCPKCGKKVQGDTCPACGKAVEPDDTFCMNCGQSLTHIQSAQATPLSTKSEKDEARVASVENAQEILSENEKELDGSLEVHENSDSSEDGKSAVLSAANGNDQNNHRVLPTIEDLREIVGKNDSYYLAEFEKIAHNEKAKFNWAAFFLNGAFSYYRKSENIFWKYCKKFYILYGSTIVLGMLTGIRALNSFKSGSMDTVMDYIDIAIVSLLLSGGISIYGLVCAIRFSSHFNEEYYRHCLEMAKRPVLTKKVGTSVGRGFLFYLVVGCCVGLVTYIFSMVFACYSLSLLGDMMDDTDYSYGDEQLTSSDAASPPKSDLSVEIGDAYLTADYSGNAIIVVSYTWTNTTDTTTSPAYSISAAAYQDGVALDQAYYIDDPTYDSGAFLRDVRPGVTVEIQDALVLRNDTSSVEFEIKPWLAHENDPSTTSCTFRFGQDETSSPTYDESITTDTPEGTGGYYGDSYLMPTDTQYIAASDLMGYSKEYVSLIRNEIYARYGCKFSNDDIRSYFESQSWYYPTDGLNASNFDTSILNDYERTNLETILAYEREMGWRQ